MGTLISGLAATEAIDSSGETLKIENCDISSLPIRGIINFEHTNDDPEDVVGKILYAKKIFTDTDCENEDQAKFFNILKIPCIYIIAELFDDEGHPGALAISSMMKWAQKHNEPMMMGFSIEGSTLERSGMDLNRTVAQRVACTLKPANKSCVAAVLEQIPDAKKAMGSDGFRPLHKALETEFSAYTGDIPTQISEDVLEMISFHALFKALDAGTASAVPGQNVQGAALQSESKKKLTKDQENFIKAHVRDHWDKVTPLDEFLKYELPELGEHFKDHFKEVVKDLSMKKHTSSGDIVTYRHALSTIPHSKEQKLLMAGIRPRNTEDSTPYKAVNSSGKRVIVSRGHNDEGDKNFSSEKAAGYYNLAHQFFGLGGQVPMTSAFISPKDRSVHHVTEDLNKVVSGISPKLQEHYEGALDQAASNQLLHKMAIMDYVLGHSNRHINNLVFDTAGNPYFVNNEKSFNEPNHPDY